MGTKDRTSTRLSQPSVLDTFDPKTYRSPGMILENREGQGGVFGTLTLKEYMERRNSEAAVRFTNPRKTNQGDT
jgi:hypothetical protein